MEKNNPGESFKRKTEARKVSKSPSSLKRASSGYGDESIFTHKGQSPVHLQSPFMSPKTIKPDDEDKTFLPFKHSEDVSPFRLVEPPKRLLTGNMTNSSEDQVLPPPTSGNVEFGSPNGFSKTPGPARGPSPLDDDISQVLELRLQFGSSARAADTGAAAGASGAALTGVSDAQQTTSFDRLSSLQTPVKSTATSTAARISGKLSPEQWRLFYSNEKDKPWANIRNLFVGGEEEPTNNTSTGFPTHSQLQQQPSLSLYQPNVTTSDHQQQQYQEVLEQQQQQHSRNDILSSPTRFLPPGLDTPDSPAPTPTQPSRYSQYQDNLDDDDGDDEDDNVKNDDDNDVLSNHHSNDDLDIHSIARNFDSSRFHTRLSDTHYHQRQEQHHQQQQQHQQQQFLHVQQNIGDSFDSRSSSVRTSLDLDGQVVEQLHEQQQQQQQKQQHHHASKQNTRNSAPDLESSFRPYNQNQQNVKQQFRQGRMNNNHFPEGTNIYSSFPSSTSDPHVDTAPVSAPSLLPIPSIATAAPPLRQNWMMETHNTSNAINSTNHDASINTVGQLSSAAAEFVPSSMVRGNVNSNNNSGRDNYVKSNKYNEYNAYSSPALQPPRQDPDYEPQLPSSSSSSSSSTTRSSSNNNNNYNKRNNATAAAGSSSTFRAMQKNNGSVHNLPSRAVEMTNDATGNTANSTHVFPSDDGRDDFAQYRRHYRDNERRDYDRSNHQIYHLQSSFESDTSHRSSYSASSTMSVDAQNKNNNGFGEGFSGTGSLPYNRKSIPMTGINGFTGGSSVATSSLRISLPLSSSLEAATKPSALSSSSSTNVLRTSRDASIKTVFNKLEILESPRSKAAYKEFYRTYRQKEKESMESAKRFALDSLQTIPENAKWRIYLELADLLKRNHQLQEAGEYYKEVCGSQPKANMGWLEWAKMEEENGSLVKALNILILGVKVCRVNEGLLTKVIKLHERLHKYQQVRGLLSMLKREAPDRVWKSVLEGTLFEARTGNIAIARRLFQYLMNQVPWYGPIYFEAFRLEEKEGNDEAALIIIRRGLNELPRYGPLWFGLLRIMERRDTALEYRQWQQGAAPVLENVNREVAEAVRLISKELTWKVHFEKSQIEERAAEVAAAGMFRHYFRSPLTPQSSSLLSANITNAHIAAESAPALQQSCQQSYEPLAQQQPTGTVSPPGLEACRGAMLRSCKRSLVRSLLVCPANLRWRILLVGARLELGVGAENRARELLLRALAEVPVKSKAYVYLECSRLEESEGHVSTARQVLARAREDMKSEWKVFLESVLLEVREGSLEEAAAVARESTSAHPGTGRLWAMYIQLCHRLEHKYFSQTKAAESMASSMEEEEGEAGRSPTHPLENKNHSMEWLCKELVIQRAVREVPKSGEVWCERSRCLLNPLSANSFHLGQAQLSLCFAVQFTPQYGDSFLEALRLEMLCQVLLPRLLEVLRIPLLPFLKLHLFEDPESDLVEILANPSFLNRFVPPRTDSTSSQTSGENMNGELELPPQSRVVSCPARASDRQERRQRIIAIEKMRYDFGNLTHQYRNVLYENLNRRCVNADPNYGSVWFHCRQQPYDVPSIVLRNGLHKLVHELSATQSIYARAMLHFVRRCLCVSVEQKWTAAYRSQLKRDREDIIAAVTCVPSPCPTDAGAPRHARSYNLALSLTEKEGGESVNSSIENRTVRSTQMQPRSLVPSSSHQSESQAMTSRSLEVPTTGGIIRAVLASPNRAKQSNLNNSNGGGDGDGEYFPTQDTHSANLRSNDNNSSDRNNRSNNHRSSMGIGQQWSLQGADVTRSLDSPQGGVRQLLQPQQNQSQDSLALPYDGEAEANRGRPPLSRRVNSSSAGPHLPVQQRNHNHHQLHQLDHYYYAHGDEEAAKKVKKRPAYLTMIGGDRPSLKNNGHYDNEDTTAAAAAAAADADDDDDDDDDDDPEDQGASEPVMVGSKQQWIKKLLLAGDASYLLREDGEPEHLQMEREAELLRDLDIASTMLGERWPRLSNTQQQQLVPFVHLQESCQKQSSSSIGNINNNDKNSNDNNRSGDGIQRSGSALYCCTDFVSCMIELNRSVANFNHLPRSERRKALFGSDQIVT